MGELAVTGPVGTDTIDALRAGGAIDDPSHAEGAALTAQIAELRAVLEAIQSGGVDAVITGDAGSEQIYTLVSADRPYRAMIERMNEGALTVSERGVILYANQCFAQMLGRSPPSLVGTPVSEHVADADQRAVGDLLRLRPGESARARVGLRTDSGPVPAVLAATCVDLDGTPVHCLIVSPPAALPGLEGTDAAPTGTRHHRSARSVMGLFAVITLLPLVVLTATALRLGTDAVTNEARARIQTAAVLEARAVDVRMSARRDLVAWFAGRGTLTVPLSHATPSARDLSALQLALEQIVSSEAGISTAAVVDPAGRLVSVAPADPALLGRDFSYRDWYKGVSRTSRPYVSEAVVGDGSGHPLVVAVAADPVRRRNGSTRPGLPQRRVPVEQRPAVRPRVSPGPGTVADGHRPGRSCPRRAHSTGRSGVGRS